MSAISAIEREVLMYAKSSLDHNREEGVKASEVADSIDRPLQDVLDACEKLDQKDLIDIEKRKMVKGKAQDLEMHITNKGVDFLAKKDGVPL